jgi:hypothetical protein
MRNLFTSLAGRAKDFLMVSHNERKPLTFEQAEGAAPLPTQLRPGEISPPLRAKLWEPIFDHLSLTKDSSAYYRPPHLGTPWSRILRDYHVHHEHKMADAFDTKLSIHIDRLSSLFKDGVYTRVFGFIQFVLRHNKCPNQLASVVEGILVEERAGYRLLDRSTLLPIASEFEGETLMTALATANKAGLPGAYEHLKAAGGFLTQGKFADSIRESIHAVESAARSLGNAGSLNDALKALEQRRRLHPALMGGFEKLYAYTNDEKGIRHALIDKPTAEVDETDAIFMLGACAAFVTYLVRRSEGMST